MRTAFIEQLTKAAAADPRVMLVVGDLGFGVVTDFAKRFPDQFLNAGVAEQNMTGVAAGLAMAGKIVFTYSIANFPTLRCLEQIRNDVCYHDGNVVVVAVGGGLAYGSLGMSHHATEDLAIMRSLPNMTVLAPGDPAETVAAVQCAAAGIGPTYLRLGRAGEPAVYSEAPDFQIGQSIEVRAGDQATIIATGGMLHTAVTVADELAAEEQHVRVISMHTIRPLDEAAIIRAANETHLVITLEEHSIHGGLGGAVAEVLAECEVPNWKLHRIGLPSVFSSKVGDQEYLKEQFGLDAESVFGQIRSLLASRKTAAAKAVNGAVTLNG